MNNTDKINIRGDWKKKSKLKEEDQSMSSGCALANTFAFFEG
jgi:hypothetical protein